MNPFFSAYFGSLLLAVLLTPWVIRWARRIGAVDQPGFRGVHQRPVPRIGGVAIFLSTVGPLGAILVLDSAAGAALRHVQGSLAALLGCATLIFLIGLTDDLRDLSARHKLLAEVGVAGLLCLAGVRISSIALTDQCVLHLGGWGTLLTILWIVGVANAVNLSDGLDGLAAGICAITCGVIAIFAIHSGEIVLTIFMLALLGSLCGFLIFNFNPARIFMGDSGSLFLGFCLGACSVLCVAKSAALVGLTLPALALGIPIFDTLCSALRRFLEGRSIFAPDRNHFHHRLLDLGLRQRQAVILIYLATLLAAGLGLLMLMRKDLSSLVIFASVLFLILLLFRAVGAIGLRETWMRLQQKYACACQAHDEQRTFERLQLRVRAVHTSPQRWQTVCTAAEQLELAWMALEVRSADGGLETSIWRRPSIPAGFARLMTICFPISNAVGKTCAQCEIAVLVNGSLESAHHRGGLFVRLAQECIGTADGPICFGDTSASPALGRLLNHPDWAGIHTTL